MQAPGPHVWRCSRGKLLTFTDRGVSIKPGLYDIISQQSQICNRNLNLPSDFTPDAFFEERKCC